MPHRLALLTDVSRPGLLSSARTGRSPCTPRKPGRWLGLVLGGLLLSGIAIDADAVADARKKSKKPPRHAPPATQSGVLADDAPDLVTYGQRDDVMRFADELAQRRDLDTAWVRAALAAARFVPAAAKAIMPAPSGTAKNWALYRSRFIDAARIRAGVAFWRANDKWLQKAELQYGVPAEIVVGIIGVETIYGQQLGSFRVIDALATLAFDFPTGRSDRSAFFRDELESFLALCQREQLDPLLPKGSFAGAMGMPQFMPSSATRYAVDFDADGHIDLTGSPADVIGSVAHYLSEFGWQRGLATHFEVAVPVDASERAVLLGPDIVPTFSAADFMARGARLDAAALAAISDPAQRLALVELQNGAAAPSYVAGTANFYAVTRYNRSSYYAMAVIDLGAAVAREVQRTPVPDAGAPAARPAR